MNITRRQFVKGGVAAFTVTFAAPEFLGSAQAQGARTGIWSCCIWAAATMC
jgi:hypothetical protein